MRKIHQKGTGTLIQRLIGIGLSLHETFSRDGEVIRRLEDERQVIIEELNRRDKKTFADV